MSLIGMAEQYSDPLIILFLSLSLDSYLANITSHC